MHPSKIRSGRRARGVAAVELALILPLLIIFLHSTVYLGILLYHYTVVQKAAQAAASYLATITVEEMRSPKLAPAAAEIAYAIASEMTEELSKTEGGPVIEVFCGPLRLCSGVRSGALPTIVAVRVEIYLRDTYMGYYFDGPWGQSISAVIQMPYTPMR